MPVPAWSWGPGLEKFVLAEQLIRRFSVPIWLMSTLFLLGWVLWGWRVKEWIVWLLLAPGPLGYGLLLAAWWGRAVVQWMGRVLT